MKQQPGTGDVFEAEERRSLEKEWEAWDQDGVQKGRGRENGTWGCNEELQRKKPRI